MVNYRIQSSPGSVFSWARECTHLACALSCLHLWTALNALVEGNVLSWKEAYDCGGCAKRLEEVAFYQNKTPPQLVKAETLTRKVLRAKKRWEGLTRPQQNAVSLLFLQASMGCERYA